MKTGILDFQNLLNYCFETLFPIVVLTNLDKILAGAPCFGVYFTENVRTLTQKCISFVFDIFIKKAKSRTQNVQIQKIDYI